MPVAWSGAHALPPYRATFPATVKSVGRIEGRAMEKKRARTGNPLGLGSSYQPGLVEPSHVASSAATYFLESRTGKSLPRFARPRRRRPGPVFLRHAPGRRLGPLLRRVVPLQAFGRLARRPAQTP